MCVWNERRKSRVEFIGLLRRIMPKKENTWYATVQCGRMEMNHVQIARCRDLNEISHNMCISLNITTFLLRQFNHRIERNAMLIQQGNSSMHFGRSSGTGGKHTHTHTTLYARLILTRSEWRIWMNHFFWICLSGWTAAYTLHTLSRSVVTREYC